MHYKRIRFFDNSQNKKLNTQNYPSFITFLLQFGDLPEEIIYAITSKLICEEFPKKHILLKKGNICTHLYFIEKGLARNFFEEDNKEQTNDITRDGELLVSFASFISKQPSFETIELLEDSVLYSIHHDDLQELYRQYPTMEHIGRLIAEYHYNELVLKNYRLKFSNSTERYENLFNSDIEIIKRTPIGVIASYLGMSIETLSRIRGKLD